MSLNFAREELNVYHSLITNGYHHQIEVDVDKNLSVLYDNELPFNEFDDIYTISVTKGKGKIIGVNERSVLLGVYAYFRALGCRFLKPGKANEIIPELMEDDCNVSLTKVFSNRHRTVCIEGANSVNNVTEMIDFLPKNGMNGYFIQFFTPYEFFERWYKHQKNSFLHSEHFTINDAKMIHTLIVDEIKKRNLIYHAVGHGWTMEALGYKALGWHKATEKSQEIDKRYLAKVNGKRDFFEGVPLNTQLCYSNHKVKEKIVDAIVSYALDHKEVDILHFWLADNFNNFCECNLCKDKYPSENYIEMLNMLDKKLTEHHLNVKIAFLIYFELLWVKADEKIDNPDRFIMMFAPITRTFTKSYKDTLEKRDLNKTSKMIEFKLNKNTFPENVEENLVFLEDWQKVFKGDSFLFDYHLMWDGYKDYTMLGLSRTIYDDMKSLKDMKLNGFISCQLQRIFFPTGHAFYTLVESLSNDESYNAIQQDYFTNVYGDDAQKVYHLLEDLSSYFYHSYARAERPMVDIEVGNRAKEVREIAPNYLKEISIMILSCDDKNKFKKRELEVLYHFVEYVTKLSKCIEEKAYGNISFDYKNCKQSLEELMLNNELKFQDVYDGYFFHHVINEFLEKKW